MYVTGSLCHFLLFGTTLVVASATLHAGHIAISVPRHMAGLSEFLHRTRAAPRAGAPCTICDSGPLACCVGPAT